MEGCQEIRTRVRTQPAGLGGPSEKHAEAHAGYLVNLWPAEPVQGPERAPLYDTVADIEAGAITLEEVETALTGHVEERESKWN